MTEEANLLKANHDPLHMERGKNSAGVTIILLDSLCLNYQENHALVCIKTLP